MRHVHRPVEAGEPRTLSLAGGECRIALSVSTAGPWSGVVAGGESEVPALLLKEGKVSANLGQQ